MFTYTGGLTRGHRGHYTPQSLVKATPTLSGKEIFYTFKYIRCEQLYFKSCKGSIKYVQILVRVNFITCDVGIFENFKKSKNVVLQGYGGFSGHIMMMYVMFLLSRTKKLHKMMSSYQIMRNTLVQLGT